jgi:hypothetical protein
MKSFKIVCFLLFVIMMSTEFSQAQWTLQNDSLFFAAGIKNISIVNSNVVWALAYNGAQPNKQTRYFTRTINGGSLWKADSIHTTPAVPPDQGIGNIIGISADTAWISTFSPTGISIGGIYRTNDGGLTWTNQTTAAFNISSFPDFVYFWDKNHGIAFGDPNPSTFEIYTTTDGGTTWVLVPSGNLPAPQAGEYGTVSGYSIIGSTVWEVTTSGRILKSTDMGLHWTIATILANKQVSRPVFKDANNGLCPAGLKNDTLMRTTDGGLTWNHVNVTGSYLKTDLCYAGGTNPMYVCVSVNTPLGTSYSTDDGTTWINLESTERHTCVSFLNSTTGWSGTFTTASNPPTGGIYKWSGNIGIEEYKNILGLKLYPNPNNGIFHITQENSRDGFTQISIFDLAGKLVCNSSLNNNVTEQDLDLTSQPKGLYFVRVINSKGESAVQKLVIE